MYKIYRLNGQEYHVYPSGEQKFLSENPDAELVKSVEEATETEPIVEDKDSVDGKVPYSINNQEVTKEEFDNYTANEELKKYNEEDLANIKARIEATDDILGEFIKMRRSKADKKPTKGSK